MDAQGIKIATKEYETILYTDLEYPLMKYLVYKFNEGSQHKEWKKKGDELKIFQEEMKAIPKYNKDQIKKAKEEILKYHEAELDLEEILKIIFKNNAMILASQRPLNKANQPFNVPIPSLDTFFHTILTKIAQPLFYYPSILNKSPADNTESERLEKLKKLQKIVKDGFDAAIIQLKPTKEIIDRYFREYAIPPSGGILTTQESVVDEKKEEIPPPVVEEKKEEQKEIKIEEAPSSSPSEKEVKVIKKELPDVKFRTERRKRKKDDSDSSSSSEDEERTTYDGNNVYKTEKIRRK
jgi:hypothetical protein